MFYNNYVTALESSRRRKKEILHLREIIVRGVRDVVTSLNRIYYAAVRLLNRCSSQNLCYLPQFLERKTGMKDIVGFTVSLRVFMRVLIIKFILSKQ